MDPLLIMQVKIENISLSNLGFVIFLKGEDEGRVLPIFIGAPEAHSIAAAYNNHKFPRPLTHDLFKNILELLECRITQVIITDLVESTFFSKIYLQKGEETIQIDARPSDAVAMALRFRVPIYVTRTLMETTSISLQQEEMGETVDTIQQMKSELEQAVSEERYEDAARIRDELKKLQNDN